MKRISHLLWIVLVVGCSLSKICARDVIASSNDSSQATDQLSDQDYQRAKDAALAQAQKRYEEALTNPPPQQIRLPNFMTGPGRPNPIGVNFYEQDKNYPEYLMCLYSVEEKHYNQTNEPNWFKAALLQIRGYGPQRFPLIRWIAVIIKNDAEHKGASTFEQSFKVGAIFSASEVFDSSQDLMQLIARSEMDKHPFVYDPKRESPGEQQRWVIVERHATVNHSPLRPS